MTVGVLTPLLGYRGTGTGPDADRDPPLRARPLPPAAGIGPPVTRSDIEACSSSKSGVNGNGFRIASSSANRIAEAVRREITVLRGGQYELSGRLVEVRGVVESPPSSLDKGGAACNASLSSRKTGLRRRGDLSGLARERTRFRGSSFGVRRKVRVLPEELDGLEAIRCCNGL